MTSLTFCVGGPAGGGGGPGVADPVTMAGGYAVAGAVYAALEELYYTLQHCLTRRWSFKARRVSGTKHADSEMLSRGRAQIVMGPAVDPTLAVLHHRSDLGHRKCTDNPRCVLTHLDNKYLQLAYLYRLTPSIPVATASICSLVDHLHCHYPDIETSG
jgi:hypothetical protein